MKIAKHSNFSLNGIIYRFKMDGCYTSTQNVYSINKKKKKKKTLDAQK
jgi:hypothetical protein